MMGEAKIQVVLIELIDYILPRLPNTDFCKYYGAQNMITITISSSAKPI